ncbi:SusC/RagA family TonB-linked outer membrane protein [Chitinophaga sp. Mgbs1]|uniref:SusC/RagA family TonB-linked outer membrane protein n=1 Tax=Chitinophaga solisilvae TaxID=1233460 RepID=A0A9Q5GTA7_9BACT|nr:SusC/RagA family TonB-linked outer membrane protein [Chitinophaga solisilvae]
MLKSILTPMLAGVMMVAVMSGIPGALQASRLEVAQDGPEHLRVNVNVRNVPLKEVFKLITKQTGLNFFGSAMGNAYEERVSFKASQEELKKVLDDLLIPIDYTWIVNNDVIIVRKKNKIPISETLVTDTSALLPVVGGIVTDVKGVPIPGATIVIKGTRKGVTTDVNGRFTLKSVPENGKLLITYIGYESREIPAATKNIIAQLKVNTNNLDEMVVVAYGTTTKRFNVGNVTSIKAEDIERQPVTDPMLALQGRVPGLEITQSSGVPGGSITVRVQGENSIANGNDPFYVVDGVPYPSQAVPNRGTEVLGNGASGSPLSYINPSDIESITVLKDADATAIYGSRAANGAIIITTKKGVAGRTRVNVSYQTGWGKVVNKLPLLNTKEYLMMRNEALRNDKESPSLLLGDYDLLQWDTTRYTDWQKELIGKTAHYSNVNASVSGGNDNVQYLIGGTYRKETSVFAGDFSDVKSTVHFNINSISQNKKFNVTLSGNYQMDNNQLPRTDLTNMAVGLSPNAPPVFLEDGSLNWALNTQGVSTWSNPYALIYCRYTNKTTNLLTNLSLGYKLLPGLEIKASLGYNNLLTNDMNIRPITSIEPETRSYSTRAAGFGKNSTTSWIVEPQISYGKSIGKGRLDVLIGMSINQKKDNNLMLYGQGYSSDLSLSNLQAAPEIYVTSSKDILYKYIALFGRVSYSLKDRYIVNLTARRDGTSRFGPENRFHNFGAIGAGWLFSETSFIKENLSILSFGKLRASYGTTGNDQIADYSYMNLYETTYGRVPYLGVNGLTPTGLTNPYLQWEETKKMTVGLDLNFFKDRITFVGNYYKNQSSNQLIVYNLPIIAGFPNVLKNFPATIQNSGIELSLSSNNFIGKDFKWTTSVNLTIPNTKLIAFQDLDKSPYGSTFILGKPVSILRLYESKGVDPETGVYQFSNSHGGTTQSPSFLTDKIIIGNTRPELFGGLQNDISYKGFSLNFNIQFTKATGTNYRGGFPGIRNQNQPEWVLKRWQKPGDNTSVQKFSANSSMIESVYFASSSDLYFNDASFIRLKNISLSYRLPLEWLKRIHVESCNVYVQGQNLLTISSYQGLDPETRSVATLPPLKVLTLGITVGL